MRVNESEAQQGIRTGRENLAQSLLGGVNFSTGNEGVQTPAQLQNNLLNVSKFRGNLPEVGTGADLVSGLQPGGDLGRLDTDYMAANERAADAIFQRGVNKAMPDLNLQQRRTDADLAARGIPVGSEAYSTEQDRLGRNRNDFIENLGLSAITAGNQEAGRLFGQDLSTFNAAEGQRGARANEGFTALGFDETQRQNRMNEQIAQLQAQLAKQGFIQSTANQNEGVKQGRAQLAAALGNPNTMFVNPPGVDAAGIMQQDYQNRMAAQQNKAQNMLGLGNLGVAGYAAYAASDRRLKENIELVDRVDGVNVYEFSYIDQSKRYRGVMAQEVQETHPDAVMTGEDGFLRVDYSKLPVTFEEVA